MLFEAGLFSLLCSTASALLPRPNFPNHPHVQKRSSLASAPLGNITKQWFTQKSNHFGTALPAGVNATFQQKYYIDRTYYKPGGPVIILDGGEDTAEDRIPFMQTGIVYYLMESLGGIGIILEHRYYGDSFVSKDLSVPSLALLDTAQALADNAYFAQNLYKDLKLPELCPTKTPFISYGGSYAGGKSAFLQVTYPDVFWGSIAGSGVIHAVEEFWQYYEPQRQHGDPKCISVIEQVAQKVDKVIAKGGKEYTDFMTKFGVQTLHPDDAANAISEILGIWQSGNWDKSLAGANDWDIFCKNLTATPSGIDNYATYMRGYIADNCGSQTVEQCFGSYDVAQYKKDDLSQDWRLWQYQVCTEWGYYASAAPAGRPSLIPQAVTVEYLRKICNSAFDFPSSLHANTTKVNQYGSFKITEPRLLFVDGKYDPWLYATANSPLAGNRKPRGLLIDESWHHNDENGLGDLSKEPRRIRAAHKREISEVGRWVREFYKKH